MDLLNPGTSVSSAESSSPPAPEPKSKPATSAPPAPVIPPPAIPIDPAALASSGGGAPKPRRGGKGKWIVIISAVLLLLAAGGAAAWYFLLRDSEPVTPVVTQSAVLVSSSLNNLGLVSGDSTLPAGAATNQSPAQLGFTVATTGNQGTVTGQVEVVAMGAEFTGTPTATGEAITATGKALPVTVSAGQLKDGQYRWQARIKVGSDVGAWALAGTDASKADFVIDTVVPSKPVMTTADAQNINQSTKSANLTLTKPVLSGTADPVTAIEAKVQPENVSLKGVADASGVWTITPTADLASGAHTIVISSSDAAGNSASETYQLTIATASAAATTPTPSPSPTATPTPTPSPTPTVTPQATPVATPVATPEPTPSPTKLAETGDPVGLVSLLSLVALIVAGLAWFGLRRAQV